MKAIQRITAAILAIGFLFGSFTGAKAAGNAAGAVYYVSPSGSGTSCSSSSPCSLSTGMNKVGAGDTLALQGTFTSAITFSKSGTSSARINITGGKIAAPHSANDAVLVSGSFLNISNLDVSGGLSFGMRVKGHDIKLTNVSVHDSVWENRSGSACLNTSSGGWGRGLTFAPSTYNIEVAGGAVYNNCGEGVGFTQNHSSYMHGTAVFDNYSRNVYIGNATGTTVEGINSYYSNPNFYRSGQPGRCIGLAIEQTNYSTYGNMMRDATIRGNTLTDCKGINFYAEVSNQYPTNVLVENNTFVRIPSPQVDIPGTNIIIRNNTGTSSSSNETLPTATAISPTPIPATPVSPTSGGSETTIDDKQGWSYTSGWSDVSSGQAVSGSYHQTSKNGASATYQFTGSSFSIIYKGGPSYRKMDVYVDGAKVGTIDQQRADSTYNLRWDYPSTLTYAQHALKLVFVGTKSTNKGSIDALIVR